MGIDNPRKEKWGPFGRGWSYSKFEAHLLEPGYQPLIGFPLAWTPATNGTLTAEPFFAPMKEEKDLPKYKGKLNGKIVLIDEARPTPLQETAAARRHSGKDLDDIVSTTPASRNNRPPSQAADRWNTKRNEFLKEEGAVALLSTGYRGDGGTVFASRGGSFDGKYPDAPPTAAIAPEHYNRIVRLLRNKFPVKLRLEIAAEFRGDSKDSYNIVAEIPGRSRRDEMVMLGAHFDSWHGGTGATDNAAGSAVMIEAVRILKATGLPLERTVRLALWSGEEQGLLGSKAYVKEHFADPEKMQPTERTRGWRPISTTTTAEGRSGACTFRATIWSGRCSRIGWRRSAIWERRT
ncbi:MAG: M20/M25/M40 family metallo-hydrolase [Acidobacteria bacterium]|nr:M20/M25/M40 family metallo-hydrolase [Acidobacteriota bacterium]